MTVKPIRHGSASLTLVQSLRDTLGRVIRGKPEAIDLLLVGVLARGHVSIAPIHLSTNRSGTSGRARVRRLGILFGRRGSTEASLS